MRLFKMPLRSGSNTDFSRQRNGFYPLDVVDKLEDSTMSNVEAYMNKKIAAGKNNGCTLETAGVRREW